MRDLLVSGDRIATGSGKLIAGVNDLQIFAPQAGRKIRILSLLISSGGSFRWFIETAGGQILWNVFTVEIQYDSGIEVKEKAILRVDATFPAEFAWTASFDEVQL